jgi:zinc protease
VPDATRIQDRVTLAETVGLVRSNPDYYALQLGNGVLGGSFYSTRLTRDIRMIAGLVYSIQSSFDINKTRGIYVVHYACNPENVLQVQQMVEREIEQMQETLVTDDELRRAKTLLLQKTALAEESVDRIASGIISRIQLDLPIDEPTIAARRFVALDARAVQAAFTKWVRPAGLVRVSQGPAPQ